jgi:hypothetical protein
MTDEFLVVSSSKARVAQAGHEQMEYGDAQPQAEGQHELVFAAFE